MPWPPTRLEEGTSAWQTPPASPDESLGEGFFGERAASVYDEHAADMFDPAAVGPVVQMLAELAGRGGALEFGIGTGRIALPLAERGVRVAGIDNSEAMVARLRAKPGGEDIDVTIGDFAQPVSAESSRWYISCSTRSSTS
jgi:SAM-dependent methyltransferase